MTDETIITGYKATNQDMSCRDVTFELGKWYSVEGELKLCKNGFHFCPDMSGVWSYYLNCRVFKIEAKDVLDAPIAPGANYKMVCRHIRLVEEVTPKIKGDHNTGNYNTGYCNTGDYNTGNRNTGDRNTGNGNTSNGNTGERNTGDYNTGNRNTGNCNIGDYNIGNYNTGNCNTGDDNTGHCNTGNGNTGNGNTGHCNTGNGNTGNCNTGNYNTGYCNTGNYNTGNYNATNYSSGFFCIEEPKVISFDEQTNLTRSEFVEKFPEYISLCNLLNKAEPIDFNKFKNIPGITPEKLKTLHEKFLKVKQI